MTKFCGFCIGGANAAAAVVAYVTHDLTLTAVIGGITAASLAIVGSVKILTPAVVEAIKTIGPALAELQKQRDEIKKGSLSGQIESLRADVIKGQAELKRVTEEGNARVEDANQKLHEAKQAANADAIERANQISELREELTAAREETRKARLEIHQFDVDNRHYQLENRRLLDEIAGLKARQAVQGQAIVNNKQAIDDTKAAVAEIAKAAEPTLPPDDPRAHRG